VGSCGQRSGRGAAENFSVTEQSRSREKCVKRKQNSQLNSALLNYIIVAIGNGAMTSSRFKGFVYEEERSNGYAIVISDA
jgi:hypothetical protein